MKVPSGFRLTVTLSLLHTAQVQLCKLILEQAQKREKRFLDAAMRRRGQHYEMAFWVVGKFTEEFMSLLLGLGLPRRFSGAMHFINEDKFGTVLEEIGAVTLGFGIIYASDNVGEISEDTLVSGWQFSFELAFRAGADNHRREVEFLAHLLLPLVAKIGRTKNADALNLTSVKKFASNEQPFDSFADSHIVSYQ